MLVTVRSWSPSAVERRRSGSSVALGWVKLAAVWGCVILALLALINSKGAPRRGKRAGAARLHSVSSGLSASAITARSNESASAPQSLQAVAASAPYSVTMQLGFSLSPSDFDATMRQACARSVAATADVNATQVRITSVDVAPSAAQRRLLATRITVGVAIAEPSAAAASMTRDTFSVEHLNTQLAKNGMPTARLVAPARVEADGAAPSRSDATKLSAPAQLLRTSFDFGLTPRTQGRQRVEYWKEHSFDFQQPAESRTGPESLPGSLARLPGARPASIDFSSAGPGWLSHYTGQLTGTKGTKMNSHLHRLLFLACQSATMDFHDTKTCMSTHGVSPSAALQFLRRIPQIKIDNSKSETAHYVYGSDPYLLGEDWPRQGKIVVHNSHALKYHPPEAVASENKARSPRVDAAFHHTSSRQADGAAITGVVRAQAAKAAHACDKLFVTVGRVMHLPLATLTGKPPSTFVQIVAGSKTFKTETIAESTSPSFEQKVTIPRYSASAYIPPAFALKQLHRGSIGAEHDGLVKQTKQTEGRQRKANFRSTLAESAVQVQRQGLAQMSITVFDVQHGQEPTPVGSASFPVGGDMGEAMLTLKLIGSDGLPVLGDDGQFSQAEVTLRCASADGDSGKALAGEHCGVGKTGTPDLYDIDCATGYCGWQCQGIEVSMCMSCYYGDCVCKPTKDRLDPETGKWVDSRRR